MAPFFSYPEHHAAAFAAIVAWCVLLGVLATRQQAGARGYFDTMFHGRVDRSADRRRFRRYAQGIALFSTALATVAIGLTWLALR
jgi:hypothetical protein